MPSGVTVPLTFQIYKGTQLVRTVTLAQDIIKVGKLSSSTLRIEDESVSRMHAVIEVAGPGDISIIDLGSTRGTIVNGQKINKAKLQSGDKLQLGDTRIVVTVAEPEEQATPVPAEADPDDETQVAVPPSRVTTMGTPLYPSAPMGPVMVPPPPAAVPAPFPPPRPAFQEAGAPPALPPVPPPLSSSGIPPVPPGTFDAGEVEVQDGSRAVEVAAMFEDAVLEVRHLNNPAGGKVTPATKGILASAAVSLVATLVLFLVAYGQVAEMRAAREEWERAGKPYAEFPMARYKGGAGMDVAATAFLIYGVVALFWGLFRFFDERKETEFTIGADPHVTFTTGEDLPVPSFPLVHSTGADYEVLFTPQMRGDITDGSQV